MIDWQMELATLVVRYGAGIAADVVCMTQLERFGLYLYLLRVSSR